MIFHIGSSKLQQYAMNQLQQQQQSPSKSNGGCFRCNKVGHWAQNCPLNPNNRSPISHPSSCSDYPPTHCPCGAGFCEIRVSQSERNPDRKYYCCPGKFENYCGYFKWCDQLKTEQILKVQPKPFPICRCEAGVCRVMIEENEPNIGRAYFACHMKKGDGACKFRQWVDLCEPSMEVEQELLSYEAEMQIDAVEMMFSLEFSHQIKDHVHLENGVVESSGLAYGSSAGSPELHHHSVRNNILGSQLEFVEASTEYRN